MDQIFMIEVFVTKVILKVEPYIKDEYELKEEKEEMLREEKRLEALAAAEALKKKKAKPKKPKKPKKGKIPVPPTEDELRFMAAQSLNMYCEPVFNFGMSFDNFIPPPPPPKPPKKAKKKKAKPKKAKPIVFKPVFPPERVPAQPFYGVGNTVMFVSRPAALLESLKKTPIEVTVWDKDQTFDCTGVCTIEWHESFFKCLQEAEKLNPLNVDLAEFRETKNTEMINNTVMYHRRIHCEEQVKRSGEVEFYIRLSCLGNKLLTYFVSIPEMERIPGRKYLLDFHKLKDLEVVRHWDDTKIDHLPPIAYIFGGPDICRHPIIDKEEEPKEFDGYIAPYTQSELKLLAMGFPKGPCGGTNCLSRLDYRGSEYEFIKGTVVKGKGYQPGSYVNKRDVHGPCGRLDCPLAKKVRQYLCNEGAYKPCRKPCPLDYY